MASQNSLLMAPIPPATKLLAVNTGILKPLGQLSINSAIDKTPRYGRVHVSNMGLVGDEHDMTFHGGRDKALHQYCMEHYPKWRELYSDPEIQTRFVPGTFGENLVAEVFSDSNVCIGDIVRIGWPSMAEDASGEWGRRREDEDGGRKGHDAAVLLEVSLPRQPCFQLNTRFGIKNFAKRTIELSRTGWYYRILREGWIEEGMEVRVLERKHPRWTIEALQHYTHRDMNDRAALEELAKLKELGMEARKTFQKRLKKMTEDEKRKDGKEAAETWIDYEIVEKRLETPRIMRFVLNALQPTAETKSVSPGSHVRIRLANGLIRAYSIVNGTRNNITICVALAEHSRGGSQYLHDSTQVHDVISVGKITTSVPLASGASNHILIAGGVGITAFMAAISKCEAANLSYQLHYAVRSNDDVAFAPQLGVVSWKGAQNSNEDGNKDGGDNRVGKRYERMSEDRGSEGNGDMTINIYDKARGQRMDISKIIGRRKWNSHVYVCGPPRMMDAVLQAAREFSLQSDEVHYEAFQTTTSGAPFTVEVVSPQHEGKGERGDDRCVDGDKPGDKVAQGGTMLQVGAEQTLLEVLRGAGFEVASSCEVGNCGTCHVGVRAGYVEHRGNAFGDAEKTKHRTMLTCVSRGVGHISIEFN